MKFFPGSFGLPGGIRLITLLTAFVLLNFPLQAADDANAAFPFDREQLFFSMKFHGLPSATVTMQARVTEQGMVKISSDVNTKPLYNLLFHIHNHYETFIAQDSGLPIRSVKKIDQKNIRQQLEIVYDRDLALARTSWDSTWTITADAYDLFSMLYKIRRSTKDTLNMTVHIEGQLWRVSGVFEKAAPTKGKFGKLAARTITLSFRPYDIVHPRTWKTDLLTNRIARANSKLIITLGPPPDNLPILLRFGAGDSSVEMRLVRKEKPDF